MRKTTPSRSARSPLGLEWLEDRTTPSTAITTDAPVMVITVGGSPAETVTVQVAAGGQVEVISSVSGTLTSATLASAVTSLTVNLDGQAQTLSLAAVTPAAFPSLAAVAVADTGGADSLTFPNVAQTVTIAGADSGTSTAFAAFAFAGIESLVGGSANDLFAFTAGSSVSGTIDGGGGTDTLDYSAFTTPVAVNLGANAPGLTATLGADQEVPETASTATGTATITYNNVAHTFDINVTVEGIPAADVTGFHIHRAPFGVNGPIIVDFGTGGLTPTATGFTFAATGLALNPLHEAALLGGVTYLNVHTAANPGGAIRGQIVASGAFVAAPGTATGVGGAVSNVENATGGSGSFTVGPATFGDGIVGTAGVNVLRGGPGNDVLVGVQGNDVVQGEDGDDVLIWSNGDNTDVMDGGAGADRVQVNGALGKDDAFTVAPGAGGRVDFDRTNLVPFGLDIGTVEQLAVIGYSGNDTFSVAALTGVTDLTAVTLAGLDGNDTFNVTPQVTVQVTVRGGLPTTGAPADALNVDTTGTTNPRLGGVVAGPGDSRTGTWLFDDRQPIAFAGIEQLAGTADLSVVLADSPDPVSAGADLTYSIVVLNSGPVSATGVQFQTLVPAGTTFVSFAAPAGWTVTTPAAGGTGAITADRTTFATADGPQVFTLVVRVDATATGTVTATAGVTSVADPTVANNTDTETTAVASTADLGVTKTNGTVSLVPGASTTYTIVVSNTGPSAVAGVVLTDLFPGLTGVTFTAVGAGGAAGFTASGSGTINDTLTLPAGATVTYTATGTVGLASGETLTNTASLALPAGVTDANPANNTATDSDAVTRPTDVLVGVPNFAAGPDVGGGPTVTYYNPDGTAKFSLTVFDAALTGGVRVAVADFTGDGVPDLAVGTGPGASTLVRVFDGVSKAELFSVVPFEASFTGGVYVAGGDVNGDGRADLIITPDEGGGPRVRIFSGDGFGLAADFLGIEDPAFRGGARAAVGDVNGDGRGDLLVAAGFGGGPRIAVFDGTTLLDPLPAVVGAQPPKLFGDFFVFEDTLRNGVFITSGDLDGDGFAEVIAGGGPGGGPRVFALSGQGLIGRTQTQLANFFAGDTASRGGIRLAAKDLDGDTRADLVVGAGTGAGSRVTGYLGSTIPADGTPPEEFAFDAFAGFTGGVFVG